MQNYIKNYVKIFVTIYSFFFFFFTLAKGKKKKTLGSGNSSIQSFRLVVNILPIQVSVMILLILTPKPNCSDCRKQNKMFCKALYMTFRKANAHNIDSADRKAMPCFCGLLFLLLH